MSSRMEWKRLLSQDRSNTPQDDESGVATRSDFDRDYDRIAFSSAFRRLQDKTQVFPLSDNDFTRTRLTHSIETSCVGRSLGRAVGRALDEKNLQFSIDVGGVVAAACLAHDIGNPPFGHSGEAAIQRWAAVNAVAHSDNVVRNACELLSSPQEKKDLASFEGNAQGMRVVTKLQAGRQQGGLRLTYATLGAMMKYPCGSLHTLGGQENCPVHRKKFGFFADEANDICAVANILGMIPYEPGAFFRHPLAFLVEAADDICYAIIDLEDSVDQGLIKEKEALELLGPLASRVEKTTQSGSADDSHLGRSRARTIRALVEECCLKFADNHDQILQGELSKSLIDLSDLSSEYERIRDAVKKHAYHDERVLSVEVAGFQVIKGLLDIFVEALIDPGKSYHSKLIDLFPKSYLGAEVPQDGKRAALDLLPPYRRILAATDYISGMTDRFAVNVYQKLTGIRLPR